jgi:serine protease AprX
MPRGLDDKGRFSDGTLRRFVFQTYGRARRTQDSPIMPDVWLHYIRLAEKIAHANIAKRRPPEDTVDLLLTPWSGIRPGRIVADLRRSLRESGAETGNGDARRAQHSRTRIALSDSRIVICASFKTLVCHIVPLCGWWRDLFPDDSEFDRTFDRIRKNPFRPRGRDAELCRYVALVGFIDRLLHADSRKVIAELAELAHRLGPSSNGDDDDDEEGERSPARHAGRTVIPNLEKIYDRARRLLWHSVPPARRKSAKATPEPATGIFLISLNRPAVQTLFESRSTVKADAAHRVFEIDTTGIAFAVIDGGIDATHPAFVKRTKDGKTAVPQRRSSDDYLRQSRVKATYDFTRLRDIIDFALTEVDPTEVPPANEKKPPPTKAELARIKNPIERLYRLFPTEFRHLAIRHMPENARDLDWEIVRPLITVPHNDRNAAVPYVPPGTDHGTHVAGILAAGLRAGEASDRDLYGMCPHMTLYDLRVFDSDGKGDEFAILAAVEFVGWLNRDRAVPVVHGVNLSLALAHDVDSFACGQTPICEACNHLVGNGTVVVAAAGNTGFENGGTPKKQSMGTGYRAISITDPGNAELVITVGSTHRRDPHCYGVSYFSARGPTGDGRRKPDILAPGEKITSTIPNQGIQRMDGTSMAAPHVAGAAAMLMARYPELIGRPTRIKEILMATATDLKREPSFQGAGLVDVLRALQSV